MLLYDPARHEPLRSLAWDEAEARAAIERIVADARSRYTEDAYWPRHPLDRDGDESDRVQTSLYSGACGVVWALRYLEGVGAVAACAAPATDFESLLRHNRAGLGDEAVRERASFLRGDTPIRLMQFGAQPSGDLERILDELIAGNVDHPSRELMWGAPGTLLAALFLYERTGDARWAERFQATAHRLWTQLEWSERHQCAYWTQPLYGWRCTYLDAVHGFVGTALPLIRGRHLLDPAAWTAWQRCIVETVRRTCDRAGTQANWRPQLDDAHDAGKKLLQLCHGAPGFVVCLAGLPDAALDEMLVAAGETVWAAGPLAKGSNLCHGTGGNGYALLKLYERTGHVRWLERARAFAMHAIAQTDAHAARYGQRRYSLWTGDPGLAIYLWDCVRAKARFPTLDVFYSE